ncbi:phage tail tape measure protein [Streptomyces caelestis]|uniref:phage tail tape measure protein n=1 Tax=Streptomyces caelestis TaxID=36816 RepID=UPI00344B6444
MAVEVGVGYVSVVPEARGFGRLLNQQISGETARVGTAAGQDTGRGFLGGLGGALKAGVVGVAAGAGALFAAGFAEAVEQDKSNAKLGAQLGLTEKESARAGKLAGKVYASGYGESIDQVNDSLRSLAQNGVASINAPRRELAGLSKSALNLAEAFDVDVADAARAAGQMIRTGLAKDGREAFDLITAGFQNGADKGGDFIDTINEYGTQWRKAGLDGATSIGLISQALQAGARDGDIAADVIKEFSLRAIDGSKTTADGFKLLGLNADDMAARFAKGGKSATAVLQLTLDKLRGIKDPVKQSAAAVALFGTQSEDLGAALLAMDPSTAAAGLGKVGGAATRMGKTLHNTATQPLEVFKRRALQGLATFADKYALPALQRFGSFLNTHVLPPAREVGGALVNVLVPAVRETGDAIAGTVQWVRDYGAWLIPLGIAIGGIAVVAGASAIGTWAMTAAFTAYRGIILAVTAVTRGWAVVQGVLNAVMSANPIGLVVVGIMALVAAAVVAYNKVSWFREAVQATWSGIKAGWDLLWNGALKPGFGYLMTGLRAIGDGASWLWSTVLSPVFSAISLGARILATAIVVILVTPIVLAFKALAVVGSWLWENALGPAFRAIGAGATWLWQNAIKPAWDGIVAGASWLWSQVQKIFGYFTTGMRVLGDAGTWLWRNVLQPAWEGIKAGVSVLWSGVKVIFGYFKEGLKAVGSVFTWLWEKAVSPALSGIKSVISTTYNNGIKPVFDRLKTATGTVSEAFDSARKAIKIAWDKVKGIAKTPVAFIIDTVYNDGIVKVWNAVAGAFGAPKLDKVEGFARGGVLRGRSSWRDGDDQLVPLRRGEGVAVSEAMRDPYERARLLAVNRAALHGRPLAPFQSGEGFAKGGIFGWVKSAASKGVDLAKSGLDWMKDGVKASAEAGLNRVVRPLLDRIAGSKSAYRDMISGIPRQMIRTVIDYSDRADSELEKAGIGGKGYKAGLAWARTQNGKRYQWGGNGDPSWDCSGLVSAIESVIRGQKPHRRWATGAFSGRTAPPGWVLNKRSPYMIGITNSGVGHTAGTINGVNVESRGGDGVVIGSRARSYKDGLFTHRYGFTGYAGGGRPRPGELAWVGERGPELYQFGGGGRVIDHESSMRIAAAEVGAELVAALSRRLPPVDVSAARSSVLAPVGARQAVDDGVLRRGDTIVVRIGEHEFEAVVDERVDAGLADVRKRSRAGSKRG